MFLVFLNQNQVKIEEGISLLVFLSELPANTCLRSLRLLELGQHASEKAKFLHPRQKFKNDVNTMACSSLPKAAGFLVETKSKSTYFAVTKRCSFLLNGYM